MNLEEGRAKQRDGDTGGKQRREGKREPNGEQNERREGKEIHASIFRCRRVLLVPRSRVKTETRRRPSTPPRRAARATSGALQHRLLLLAAAAAAVAVASASEASGGEKGRGRDLPPGLELPVPTAPRSQPAKGCRRSQPAKKCSSCWRGGLQRRRRPW
jgi:hypothetical protein